MGCAGHLHGLPGGEVCLPAIGCVSRDEVFRGAPHQGLIGTLGEQTKRLKQLSHGREA